MVACSRVGWVVLAMFLAIQARAAVPLKLRLETDGSVMPPGDRLEISLLFAPQETELKVEVRALILSDSQEEPPEAVRSRNPERRDDTGAYLLATTLSRKPGDPARLDSSIVVPYGDLDIGVGEHKLGYEVTGLLPDKSAAFVRATPLTLVRVKDEPRTKIQVASSPRARAGRREVKGLVVVEPDGGIRDLAISLPETVVTRFAGVQDREVQIPGAFEREDMPDPGPDPTKAPRENYLESLRSTAWVPLRHRVVNFATNRNDLGPAPAPRDRFGSEVSHTTTYGTLLVNVPSTTAHERGSLERPGRLNWWGPDPENHFFVEVANAMEKQVFLKTFHGEDVLLFVHGYNNTFEDSALRLAQFAHDIRFRGEALLFSWPSRGSAREYTADEAAASKSDESLADLLVSIAEREGAGRIHVIAHSMGNRVFMRAAHLAAQRIKAPAKPLGHVALIAPDVDVLDFVRDSRAVDKLSESMSLYFNPKDLALTASRLKGLARRAGQAAIFIDRLENIDAMKADTSSLGHTYFAQDDVLLVDLQMLFTQNLRPPQRATLSEILVENVFPLWFFP